MPTPTTSPSKPCTSCGQDHWGYECNTLSDAEKLELYKKVVKGQINRMKVVQLETGLPSTLVDLQASNIADDDDVPDLVADESDDEDEYVRPPAARKVRQPNEALEAAIKLCENGVNSSARLQ